MVILSIVNSERQLSYDQEIIEHKVYVTDQKPNKKATKANSPYRSIKNRVSIERNYNSGKKYEGSALHTRSNSSIAIMRPAKNIDSGMTSS